jgi:ribosome-associated protein
MMNELISKSQKKRDAIQLQELGVKLVALSQEKLDKLPLTAALRKAVTDARALKSYGAVRRQALWVGKLMRESGGEAILLAYEQLQADDSSQTAAFHEVELWRTRLMSEGKDALTVFIETYPSVDVQHLRQLIKKAMAEQHKTQHTGASRTLFRYLRQFVV